MYVDTIDRTGLAELLPAPAASPRESGEGFREALSEARTARPPQPDRREEAVRSTRQEDAESEVRDSAEESTENSPPPEDADTIQEGELAEAMPSLASAAEIAVGVEPSPGTGAPVAVTDAGSPELLAGDGLGVDPAPPVDRFAPRVDLAKGASSPQQTPPGTATGSGAPAPAAGEGAADRPAVASPVAPTPTAPDGARPAETSSAPLASAAGARAVASAAEPVIGDYFDGAGAPNAGRASGKAPIFHLLGTEASAGESAGSVPAGMRAAQGGNVGAALVEVRADGGLPSASSVRTGGANVALGTGGNPADATGSSADSTAGATRIDAVASAERAPRIVDGGRAPTVVRADASEPAEFAHRVYRVVRNALRRGESSLRIELDPPALGRVDVELHIRRQSLGVRLEVENEEVRTILSRHVDELSEVLRASGNGLGEVTIDLRQSHDRSFGDDRRAPSQRTASPAVESIGATTELHDLNLSGSQRGHALDRWG